MKKIKVLHIITHLPIGGAQDNTLLTVEKLDKEKYDVTLMCAPQGEWLPRAKKIPDLKLVFVKELRREIHLWYDVIAYFKLWRHIHKEKYDIVHTHSSKPGFSGRLAAKFAGTPVIVHTIHGFPFHDFMAPYKRKFFIGLERMLSNYSDKLITVSRLNMKKAVDLNIADAAKFVNIYSGIDFSKFNQPNTHRNIHQEFNIPARRKLIGMVGRLSEQKAPHYFLKAMPAVLQQVPNAHFVFVGSGELEVSLSREAKRLGIDSHISFLGFREDVADIVTALDVFVLTSLWEGLGRALTEAMFLGIPVVATAVEGVPELVVTGRTGVLAEPKNVQEIAAGIIRQLEKPDDAKAMAEKAKKNVMEKFNVNTMVTDIESVYEGLMQKNV